MAALYNEIEPYAATWLQNLVAAGLIAPGGIDDRSIERLRPADVRGRTQFHAFAGIGVWSYGLRAAGWPDDRPVWTGSCPCQPFSSAGSRQGFDDERHLWPEWFRLIAECKPPVIFGEQVASPDGLSWLDAVFADLEGAGYACAAADLCAASVGAPHIRQRLYFVAYANEGRRSEFGQTWLHDHGTPGNDATRRGADGRLANADVRGFGVDGRAPGQRDAIGAESHADIVSAPRGLDNADESRRRTGRGGRRDAERSGRWGSESSDSGSDDARGLGNSSSDRDREHAGELSRDESRDGLRPSLRDHTSFLASAARDPWRDAEWLECSDGKLRPAEPGTFPLAPWSPSRVGRLCAYGNALVGELATTFVRAVMETIDHG